LEQRKKISKLENALQNLIHLPLTSLQNDFEKNLQKSFAKTKPMVQIWSNMLKIKKQSMRIM
jgi:hypothetical protein